MNQKLAKVLACLVLIMAYIVIVDAYVQVDFLPESFERLLSLGFADGIAFFFCGIIVYSVATSRNVSNLVSDLMLPASVLIVLLLMSTMVMSYWLGLTTDIGILFSSNEIDALESAQRLLAFGEVLSFSLVALTGLNSMFTVGRMYLRQVLLSVVLFSIQIITFAGYITDNPLLKGEIADVSRASHPSVVILFAILGASSVLSAISFMQRQSS